MPALSRRFATGSMWTIALVALPMIAACAATQGGGTGGSGRQKLTGVITALQPKLCVGRPQGTGQCFTATAAERTGVSVGDCVTVTYRVDGDQRFTAVTIDRATSNSCPS
jgi:hypothetical protein